MAQWGNVSFTIASGASTGSKTYIGGSLAGVIIKGPWTAAKIAFKAYIPDTSTSTSPANPLTDTGAVWQLVLDDAGNAISIGDGIATGNQYISLGATSNKPTSLDSVQWIQVLSATTSGPNTTAVAQGQAVTGYFLVRGE